MNYMRKLGVGLTTIALLILPLAAWSQRVDIADWWRLRNYQPPSRVIQLADATTMNDYGRKLFYVNRPQLEDKTSFSQHCQGGEQSIILGCYIQNQGIFIFDVSDTRLQGIHEVTAAHEVLHAAYDRLDDKERRSLDSKLQAFFSTLTDARLTSTIKSYRDKDPSVVPNELHSIMATEVRKLPADIEEYYRRYFTDRTKIVALSEQYEKTFTDFKQKVALYDMQLASLKSAIENNEQELNGLATELNDDRGRLDRMLSSGQSESYNAAVPAFNAKVRRYNVLLAETREIIARYNKLVEERNNVALEEQALIKAIDSRIQTQSEQ